MRTRAWLRWVAVWKRAAMPSMWGGLDARSPGWRASCGVSLYSRPEGREWEHVPQRVGREVRRKIPDHEKRIKVGLGFRIGLNDAPVRGCSVQSGFGWSSTPMAPGPNASARVRWKNCVAGSRPLAYNGSLVSLQGVGVAVVLVACGVVPEF